MNNLRTWHGGAFLFRDAPQVRIADKSSFVKLYLCHFRNRFFSVGLPALSHSRLWTRKHRLAYPVDPADGRVLRFTAYHFQTKWKKTGNSANCHLQRSCFAHSVPLDNGLSYRKLDKMDSYSAIFWTYLLWYCHLGSFCQTESYKIHCRPFNRCGFSHGFGKSLGSIRLWAVRRSCIRMGIF